MKYIKNIFKSLSYLLEYLLCTTIVVVAFMFYFVSQGYDIEVIDQLINGAVEITVYSNLLFMFNVFIKWKFNKNTIINRLKINAFNRKLILPITLCSIAFVFATNLIFFELIPFPSSWMIDYEASIGETMTGNSFLIIILTLISAPIVEEILCRGLIFNNLKKVFPISLSCIISALIFGAMHGQIIWVLYTTVAGILFALIYHKSNSILSTIYAHFIFNLFGGFIVPLVTSDILFYILSYLSLAIIIWFVIWMIQGDYSEYKIKITE